MSVESQIRFRIIGSTEPFDSAAMVRAAGRTLQSWRLIDACLLAEDEAMNDLTIALVKNDEVAGLVGAVAVRSLGY